MIATTVAEYMLHNGATIEPTTEAHHIGGEVGYPFNTGKTASGKEVQLDCHLSINFRNAQNGEWLASASMFQRMLTESICARVEAILTPTERIMRLVGKFDCMDDRGQWAKLKMIGDLRPMGQVLRIGGEKYGIIMEKDQETRCRAMFDRPVGPTDIPRGTPVYGYEVPTTKPFINCQGVTIVSEPLDDLPHGETHHDIHKNLHVRINNCDGQTTIDMVCGFHVDPTKASLR